MSKKREMESRKQLAKMFRGSRRVALLVLVSVGLLTAAASARLISVKLESKDAATTKNQARARAAVEQSAPTQNQGGAHSIMLRASGFDPAEMIRPIGGFTLGVDKASISEELVLRLAKEDGTQLEEMQVPADVLNWYKRLELPKGQYTLTVANHPEWTCHITIQ
jgi:hypothetical protein